MITELGEVGIRKLYNQDNDNDRQIQIFLADFAVNARRLMREENENIDLDFNASWIHLDENHHSQI